MSLPERAYPLPDPPERIMEPPYSIYGALLATLQGIWRERPDLLADWEVRFISRVSGLDETTPTEPQIRLLEHIARRVGPVCPDQVVEPTPTPPRP